MRDRKRTVAGIMQIPQSCSATFVVLRRTISAYLRVNGVVHPTHQITPSTGTAMVLTHIVRLLRMWRRYERSVRELSQLGDRELADIGLTRAEIPAAALRAAEASA